MGASKRILGNFGKDFWVSPRLAPPNVNHGISNVGDGVELDE